MEHIFFARKFLYRMKKLSFLCAAGALIFAASCNNSQHADKAQTADAQEVGMATGKAYHVDTTGSLVNWRATHKGGLAPRYGTVNFLDGLFTVEDGQLTGGSFNIDVQTLIVNPASVTEPDKKTINLQNHLKSPDFFEAGKYPTARFEITSVAPFDATKDSSVLPDATNMVSGNLMIKDKSVNITFPAKIVVSEDIADVQAKFTVDRTTWGLNFGTEGNPADWGVSKDFELDIRVKAKVQ